MKWTRRCHTVSTHCARAGRDEMALVIRSHLKYRRVRDLFLTARKSLKSIVYPLFAFSPLQSRPTGIKRMSNKSNRVRTIDAFSCVLVLHLVLVILLSLIVLYYYYLNVVLIVLRFIPSHIYILLKIGIFSWFQLVCGQPTDGWTDTPSYRDARMHLKTHGGKSPTEILNKSEK